MRASHHILFGWCRTECVPCIGVFLEKREGKRTFGRSRRRCDNNIKTAIKGIELDVMDQIYQAEDRDQWQTSVNTVVNLTVPSKSANCFATWQSIGLEEIVCPVVIVRLYSSCHNVHHQLHIKTPEFSVLYEYVVLTQSIHYLPKRKYLADLSNGDRLPVTLSENKRQALGFT